jgi:hypothetical protein
LKKRGNEPYAWSPVMDALPDIRTCNQIVRTKLLHDERAADPATFYPNEGRAWNTDPGSRHVYKDPNRLPKTIDSGNAYRFENDTLNYFHERVKKALKVEYFLMLMQIEAKMTAREVVERKREGLSVVGANVGGYDTESLDRIHQRFLQIEAEAHRLPGFRPDDEMPQELMGEGLKVEYSGPIHQQMKLIAMEQGLLSALESSIPIFKLWPQTLDKIKASILVDQVWRANAATEDALRDDKEFTALQVEKAKQAQQMQQQAIAAQIAGQTDPNKTPVDGSPAQAIIGSAAAPGPGMSA